MLDEKRREESDAQPGDRSVPHDDPVVDPEAAIGTDHHFAPREVGSLVPEYLEAAQAEGLARVRIVHGKGTGVLRERVHAILRRHPAVASFALADERRGGWGATVVELRPR